MTSTRFVHTRVVATTLLPLEEAFAYILMRSNNSKARRQGITDANKWFTPFLRSQAGLSGRSDACAWPRLQASGALSAPYLLGDVLICLHRTRCRNITFGTPTHPSVVHAVLVRYRQAHSVHTRSLDQQTSQQRDRRYDCHGHEDSVEAGGVRA
jgi:hypothetical protein